MGSEWNEFTFEQLRDTAKTAFAMGPFGSRIKVENFVSSGIPVIKGSNLNGAFLNEEDFDYLTEEKANELSSSIAKRGDIAIRQCPRDAHVGLHHPQ